MAIRTKAIAIAGLAFALIAFVIAIAWAAALQSQVQTLSANVNSVTNTVYGVPAPTQDAVTICTGNTQVGVYTQLVTSGNYCIQTITPTSSGAQLQNGGQPELILCPIAGTGRVPIYAYKSATGDVITNSFGTNIVPPVGYNLANSGTPIGYCYVSQFVQSTVLNPIYLASASFNGGSSKATIMTYQNSPVFGSVTYQRDTNTPIGYGL